MAITANVAVRQAGLLTSYSTITYTYGSGTSTYGPTYDKQYSVSTSRTQFYNRKIIYSTYAYQYGAQILKYQQTQMYKGAGVMLPDLDGDVTGYDGTITFTAERAGRLVVLRTLWDSYNYDTATALATAYSFSAGTHTYEFKDSVELTNAINYGILVYQTDTDTVSDITQGYHYLTNISMRLTYTNARILASVAAVSPISEILLYNNPNIFTWSYSHPTNIPQTAWELHIIHDSDDQSYASGTGSTTSCTVPADTLPIGISQWYVHVTAEEEGFNLTADSEPVYIIVNANPATSDVSADGKPHLTVEWTAVDQQAASVKIGDKIYPTIWTSGGSFTVPEILDDGVYAVSVRTQTTGGDWSAWSETIYTEIRNTEPTGAGTVHLAYTVEQTVVSLSWNELTGAQDYVLYRNNVPIYAGIGTEYNDLRACGVAEYKVRALFSSGYYIESNTEIMLVYPMQDTLIWKEGGTTRMLMIRHHPQLPERRWDEASDTEFREYAGRALPVPVSNGHKTQGLSLTAAYRELSEAESLLNLLGKNVIYKSRKGDIISGVIVSASRNGSLTEAITYRITATDDDERAYLT